MFSFELDKKILEECQINRLEFFEKDQIQKMYKIKNELINKEMTNELFYFKCTEFIETINNILNARKEIITRNKEKKLGEAKREEAINCKTI